MEQNQNWTLVSVYTRAQAIEDGTLIDVTHIASTIGFSLPTVITATLFSDYDTENEIAFLLARFLAEIVCGKKFDAELVTLKDAKGSNAFLHFGPGDDGEPVLTLMRSEDL